MNIKKFFSRLNCFKPQQEQPPQPPQQPQEPQEPQEQPPQEQPPQEPQEQPHQETPQEPSQEQFLKDQLENQRQKRLEDMRLQEIKTRLETEEQEKIRVEAETERLRLEAETERLRIEAEAERLRLDAEELREAEERKRKEEWDNLTKMQGEREKLELENVKNIIEQVFQEYKVKYHEFYSTRQTPIHANFNTEMFKSLCHTFKFNTKDGLLECLYNYNILQKQNAEKYNHLTTKRQLKCDVFNFYLFI